MTCRRGETGIRAGFKIPCPQGRVGSTPTAGTTFPSLTFAHAACNVSARVGL